MHRIEAAARRIPWLVGIALVWAGLANCGKTPGESGERLEARMVNDSDLPIHILAPGEDFPAGRLEPGTGRSTGVTVSGGGVMFRAGRNGEVLVQQICGVLVQDPDTEAGIVIWTEGALSCAGAFGPI